MPSRRHRSALALPLLCSLSAALAAGCTNAKLGGEGNGNDAPDAGGDGRPDGGPLLPAIDAQVSPPTPDAGRIRLTQSSSLDVLGETSVTCPDSINSYYRVFDLAAAGVSGAIDVESVTFGLEEVVSGTGGIAATVIVHQLTGDFILANLDSIATAQTVVPDVAAVDQGVIGGALHEVPIAARLDAGSVFVVELTHLALAQGQVFLVGSNEAPQDGPTFVRGAECDEDEPIDADDIVIDGENVVMHWVLVVDGRSAD